MLLIKFKKCSFVNDFLLMLSKKSLIINVLQVALVISIGSLCLAVTYRQLISNSFTMLPGDRYDMVIMSSILEHWKNFWSGQAAWHNVDYFYPYKRTIAQTDGYFLIGILYTLTRLFTSDIFLSVAISTILLSAIGFFSLFLFSRKLLMFRLETSLFVSCVFVLFNSLVSHNQRLQLMSVYLLPTLSYLLIFYISAVTQRKKEFSTTLSGCMFGVLFGAMTITCFYIAWFYALFLLTVLTMFCLLKLQVVTDFFKGVSVLKISTLIVIVFSIISIIPFVWAYYPKSLEVGVRSYAAVSANLIAPLELIQVGFKNYLYGGFLNKLFQLFYPGYIPWGEYYNVGISPLIFGIFVLALISFKKYNSVNDCDSFFIIGLSALLCCFFIVKYHDFSLWYYIYTFIPGAKALNAVSVFLMVLALPILIIVGKYIESQNFSRSFFVFLSLVIATGELTSPYINFNKNLEDQRVANIPTPPSDCHVFYVSSINKQSSIPGFPEWVNSMYAHNVSAMMIAQIIKIPTLNGIASFNPPDWNFAAPWDQGYDQRILTYSAKHGITNLCKLDLNDKTWSVVNDDAMK